MNPICIVCDGEVEKGFCKTCGENRGMGDTYFRLNEEDEPVRKTVKKKVDLKD